MVVHRVKVAENRFRNTKKGFVLSVKRLSIMIDQQLTFHDPRCRLKVKNWPCGNKTVTAIFRVVRDLATGREFASRVTTGKQRQSPRAAVVRVVRGSDGRHYVIGRGYAGRCFIMPGTMRELHWLNPEDKLTQTISEVLR